MIPFRVRYGRSAAGVEFRAHVRLWVCPYLPIGDRFGSKSAIRRTQANVRSWHKHNAGTVPFRQLSAVRGHAWKLSALVGTGQIIIGCW
jgi:hypothetical protein